MGVVIVTQKTAANFVAVFTAEGKLLEMRKNVGQPSSAQTDYPADIWPVPFFHPTFAASDTFAVKVESSSCVRTSHDNIVVLLQPIILCLKNPGCFGMGLKFPFHKC
jgi:hypothetical protein